MSVELNGCQYEYGFFQSMLDDYQAFVRKGVSLADDTPRERIMLGSMGLGGESGEVVDLLKKHVFHGKSEGEIREKLVLELGDVLWYYALVLDVMGVTLDEVIEGNVAKLTERYPEKHRA